MLNVMCVVLFTSFIFYMLGKREGCRKTFLIAKKNNSNLIKQLKNANLFAMQLREDDLASRDGERLSHYVN